MGTTNDYFVAKSSLPGGPPYVMGAGLQLLAKLTSGGTAPGYVRVSLTLPSGVTASTQPQVSASVWSANNTSFSTYFEANTLLQANFAISASLPGTYNIGVTVTDAGGQNLYVGTKSISVVASQAAPVVSPATSAVSIQSGESATLTVSASGGGTLYYRWFSEATNEMIVGAEGPTFVTPPLTQDAVYDCYVYSDVSTVSAVSRAFVYVGSPVPSPTPAAFESLALQVGGPNPNVTGQVRELTLTLTTGSIAPGSSTVYVTIPSNSTYGGIKTAAGLTFSSQSGSQVTFSGNFSANSQYAPVIYFTPNTIGAGGISSSVYKSDYSTYINGYTSFAVGQGVTPTPSPTPTPTPSPTPELFYFGAAMQAPTGSQLPNNAFVLVANPKVTGSLNGATAYMRIKVRPSRVFAVTSYSGWSPVSDSVTGYWREIVLSYPNVTTALGSPSFSLTSTDSGYSYETVLVSLGLTTAATDSELFTLGTQIWDVAAQGIDLHFGSPESYGRVTLSPSTAYVGGDVKLTVAPLKNANDAQGDVYLAVSMPDVVDKVNDATGWSQVVSNTVTGNTRRIVIKYADVYTQTSLGYPYFFLRASVPGTYTVTGALGTTSSTSDVSQTLATPTWLPLPTPTPTPAPTPVVGATIYFNDLSTSPGWAAGAQWAFGQPTGNTSDHGGPDPTSGHTGSNVYGVNLTGAYASGSPNSFRDYSSQTTQWLTTGAIDCSGYTNVTLKFWRWLNIEAWDIAPIEVSNNGTTWTQVWINPPDVEIFSDSSWVQQTVDISSVANNQSTVYIRWGHNADADWQLTGWNIDDVGVYGDVP